MRRREGERVHGPYQHGNRWRIVIVGASGHRENLSFATEIEARRALAVAQEHAEGRTLSLAVEQYVRSLADRGLRASTVTRAEFHLRRLLQLEHNGRRPVRWIARRGPELYAAAQANAAADTHRNALAAGRSWGRWCVERGYLAADPFAAVKPLGRRRRGKPQLRIDEARALARACWDLGSDGDVGAIAVLATLLLGLRASELTSRQVRDLDDGGRLFWVPESKTAAGRRQLEVPDVLRPLLLRLAQGRAPTARLFRRADGDDVGRYWLAYHVGRLCQAAKVPRVCAHSLRGLHSTLATAAGQTSWAVAAALGHESPAITAAAYIDPAVVAAERQRTAIGALGLGTSAVRSVPSRRSN